MSNPPTMDALREEIEREIAAHKICIFSKGTKDIPMCGFTVETKQFFDKYGVPYEMVDVLNHMEKRQLLAELTNWRTLPKIFINGKFYGDTDVLAPMEENGELQALLKETFPDQFKG
jgi:monothiol glutaredoxin